MKQKMSLYASAASLIGSVSMAMRCDNPSGRETLVIRENRKVVGPCFSGGSNIFWIAFIWPFTVASDGGKYFTNVQEDVMEGHRDDVLGMLLLSHVAEVW